MMATLTQRLLTPRTHTRTHTLLRFTHTHTLYPLPHAHTHTLSHSLYPQSHGHEFSSLAHMHTSTPHTTMPQHRHNTPSPLTYPLSIWPYNTHRHTTTHHTFSPLLPTSSPHTTPPLVHIHAPSKHKHHKHTTKRTPLSLFPPLTNTSEWQLRRVAALLPSLSQCIQHIDSEKGK